MSFSRKFLSIALVVALAAAFLGYMNRQGPQILISNVRAVPLGGGYAVFLNMENIGGADILREVRAPNMASATVVGARPETDLAIPQDAKPSFSNDGAYIKLVSPKSPLREGELIPLSLNFRKAGILPAKALVEGENSPGDMAMAANDNEAAANHAMHNKAGAASHFEIDESGKAPALSLSVDRRADGRWKIQLSTQNFEFFAPKDPVIHRSGQGHGHLYLNGLKLQRMYDETAIIGALPPGRHFVSVTLNTNDHRAYSHNGMPIFQEVEIYAE